MKTINIIDFKLQHAIRIVFMHENKSRGLEIQKIKEELAIQNFNWADYNSRGYQTSSKAGCNWLQIVWQSNCDLSILWYMMRLLVLYVTKLFPFFDPKKQRFDSTYCLHSLEAKLRQILCTIWMTLNWHACLTSINQSSRPFCLFLFWICKWIAATIYILVNKSMLVLAGLAFTDEVSISGQILLLVWNTTLEIKFSEDL